MKGNDMKVSTDSRKWNDEIETYAYIDFGKGPEKIASVSTRWAYGELLVRSTSVVGTSYKGEGVTRILADAFILLSKAVESEHPDLNTEWTLDELVRAGYFTS